jgi:hypothetical protein
VSTGPRQRTPGCAPKPSAGPRFSDGTGWRSRRALTDYVEKKHRAKDGLGLKARTRADYLGMVQGTRATEKGTRQAAGFLHPLANKLLAELTAEDIREAYDAAAKKSPRRAAYSMQVLRAVLRWHGVVGAVNPLGRETAGRNRITISAPRGDPSPIPPELLGAWWRAAGIAPSHVAADYYRFQLLAGCRGIEIHGHKQHGYPPILVGDVDQRAGRVVLRAWINERAGTKVQGHGLRATFASIAEELVSSALLKRMTNHATVGDVTFGHYVATSEAQLRAGWQAVADFVEEAAKLP